MVSLSCEHAAKLNSIMELEDEAGVVRTEIEDIENIVSHYFESLYGRGS